MMKNQKKLIEIMNFLVENPERIKEEELKIKFGNEDFLYFSQYCLGGQNHYVLDHPTGYKLSQEGIRHLEIIKEKINNDDFRKNQQLTNTFLMLGVLLTAIYNIFEIISKGIEIKNNLIVGIGVMILVASFIITLIFYKIIENP